MSHQKIVYRPIHLEAEKLSEKHGKSPEALLEILAEAQTLPEGLSTPVLEDVARSLGIPAHQAYGVETFYSMLSPRQRQNVVRVCDGPVCWMKHNTQLTGKAEEGVKEWQGAFPEGWEVERSSCLGLCDRAPAILVNEEQAGPQFAKDARRIVKGKRGTPLDYSSPRKGEVRVMTALIGTISPDSIEEALAHGVYEGLKKALAMKPEEVLVEVETSGMQGRGGAGFPVGRKWRFVAQAQGNPKTIICNADESEPLIFKDRVLIDTNPHQLLEGILIGGYACGASEAWIYIRGEYPSQAQRLVRAIDQAEKNNLLGDNILGTGFSFHIHVHLGAGAYICGEETALIESLEGKRGEPRVRPPYPPQYGFRGQPSAVNNVESFCAVPSILKNGASWWKSLSQYPAPGTKLYMVLGDVNQPGLFEAPFGLTLRQIIEDFGGGMLEGSTFYCALTGGAAGTIVGTELLDVPLDYASAQKGISLGAGAFLICDQRRSVVGLLRQLLHFFEVESCGKCTPCRVGTYRTRQILDQMLAGQVPENASQELDALARVMKDASFCGLGQAVPIPIQSALVNFPSEFAGVKTTS